MEIKDLVTQLSKSPFDPVLSFVIAQEYENIGQTASAVSFYLRTAEYGYYSHPEYVYAALLKSAKCFENQTNREHTVWNLLLKAVAYLPERPEAWFIQAQRYEKESKWQECYTHAQVGLSLVPNRITNLPADVGYYGKYVLEFEKAVSAWWVGRKDEGISIFRSLLNDDSISTEYRSAIIFNLKNVGDKVDEINPLEVAVTSYRKFFGDTAGLVVDVGTRDGDDAYYLYSKLNSTKVIAVDANPVAVDLTRSKYPWMNVWYTAVSDTEGVSEFYQVNSQDKEVMGTSSFIDKNTSTVVSSEFYKGIVDKITVPVTRMDKMLPEGEVDVVKIDTEGYTWQVLQGFGDRLKDVKLLHLETEPNQLSPEHVTTKEITYFMEEQGFYLADVSYEWGPHIQDQVWVNKSKALKCTELFN
ncbi:Methyltransferase FkbM [uncultured Caudovirales phage]|uniref:Methyltransferase FkbM n=1 Tax=uncultured Caudovirales phage TaxID=2100421 RepID=A0A6J5KM45_9CAUD|nr:Methyltransferase FkbM [uncultured Caudovirales phage]